MTGNKYISIGSSGDFQEVAATQTSAGAANANQLVALTSGGVLDTSVLPSGVGVEALATTASEAISAGNLINLWLNSATLNVRNADNTAAGKYAQGYALAAISSSASGTVNLGVGFNTSVTGLTIGTDYFLGTAGAVVVGSSIPTTTNSIVQKVGRTNAAASLYFEQYPYIIRA